MLMRSVGMTVMCPFDISVLVQQEHIGQHVAQLQMHGIDGGACASFYVYRHVLHLASRACINICSRNLCLVEYDDNEKRRC
jgi:hypothetical protein